MNILHPDHLHPIDRATRLETLENKTLRGTTDEGYWNLAGPWGGITAATVMRALLEQPERLGDPVSLTLNFCAPITRGDFFVTVREVRTNRSTQHWYVELTQPEIGVAANATAVFATRRKTWGHQPARMPDVPPAANLEPMDTTGRPSWISGFDLRFVEGEIRLDRSVGDEIRGARSVLWLGDTRGRPLDFISLTALSDIFFVRILQVRGYMVPVGTVTMTTYFHTDEAELAEIGSEHVLGTADAKTFNNNFADQQAEIWSVEGKLLVTCYQTSYFRE